MYYDFPENMMSHRDNQNFLQWNLEETSRIMHSHFPSSHVIVVRPARIEYKTFSCFDNFVPCNTCGAPEHTPNHHALCHLEELLQSVSKKVQNLDEADITNAYKNSEESFSTPKKFQLEIPLWWQSRLSLDKNNLILIGFSKGCIVLNQFLYEFHYLKTISSSDNRLAQVVSRIRQMYWLDGGHPGGKNTWISSRSILETLAQLDIGIHIHVSPYQIKDDRRPWIRKEEKIFSDVLQKLGAPVTRVVHFVDDPPNLLMHFNILTAFATTPN